MKGADLSLVPAMARHPAVGFAAEGCTRGAGRRGLGPKLAAFKRIFGVSNG